MSLRIAVASSDGVNIDTHFGRADKFHIFDVEMDFSFEQIEVRSAPLIKSEGTSENSCNSGRCTGGCGSGSFHEGVSEIVELFSDCKYVLASKIGNNIEKALLKKGITAFSIELPVGRAIEKIVLYEKRLNKYK